MEQGNSAERWEEIWPQFSQDMCNVCLSFFPQEKQYIISQTMLMSDAHQNKVTHMSTFNHKYVLNFQCF